MTTRTLVVLGLVGVALVGATAMQARGAAPAPAPLEQRAARPQAVAAEGRVVTYPGAEVRIGAERAGRLLRVLVVEGQLVRRGTLLAEFESDEIRAALQEARARVAEAAAEVRLARLNLERQHALVRQQIGATRDLDQAVRDEEMAQARGETAHASVVRLEAQLLKSRVLAPIDATVTGRLVDGGETVEPGAALFTLADLRRLRIDGEADEADAAAFRVGSPVVVKSDAYPGKSWRGTVEEVADSVTLRKLKSQDPARPTDTRILGVKVAFQEATPLKLGTTVELAIGRAVVRE